MNTANIQSKSSENLKKLEALTKKHSNISGLRYMIDPQKKVSAEGIIEDVLTHMEDIDSGRTKSKPLYIAGKQAK